MGWKCTKLLLFLQLVSCLFLSLFLLEPFWTLDLHQNHDERQDVEAGSGKMFDKIARYYDSTNTVMSLGNDHAWRQKLVNSVRLDYPVHIGGLHTTIPIKHALDIATGTGEVAILLGQKAKEMKLNLTIIGLDPSAEMLRIAEEKTHKADLKDIITYRHDDVLNMSTTFPEENTFQIVTVSFGIRNVYNHTQALIEIKRVLSSFGSVYILEFSAPTSRSWLSPIKHVFLHHILPFIGKLKSGGKSAEYQHLTDSIYKFPSPEKFQSLMESIGFVQCSHENIFHDVVYLYTCSVGNKNECDVGQTCQSLDSSVQGDADADTTDVPNPSNILIVPDSVQVNDNSTVEYAANADAGIPSAAETKNRKKTKNSSMKKRKNLI